MFADFRLGNRALSGRFRGRGSRTASRLAEPTAVAAPFFPSHRNLLTSLDRELWVGSEHDRPGAIVVPTARPASALRSGLRFAARLALENGCPLVVLVSQDAATTSAVDALGRQITVETVGGPLQPDTLVLRIMRRGTKLTEFATDALQISREYRRGGDGFRGGRLEPNDVGRKRNLALLLAAGLQWRSTLFLDDDVFDAEDGAQARRKGHGLTLDTAALRAGVRALDDGEHSAVGWAARDYDDNSVLCRIAGRTGSTQDQFIGAGALLASISSETPYFSSIYNSDWLFVLALLEQHRRAGRGAVLDGGDVHQDEYPGFAPTRAAAEELGDILGEAMLSLLHEDAVGQVASAGFWHGALEERRALKDRLRDQVKGADHPLRAEMLEVLAALDVIHERLQREKDYWVRQFIAYAQARQQDLTTWGRRLHPDDLPQPARLLSSKEFDAARTFGSLSHPDEFLRRFAGAEPAAARKGIPIRA